MHKYFLFLFVGVLCTGCIQFQYTQNADPKVVTPAKVQKNAPAAAAGSVKIFTDPTKITQAYVVLGKAGASGDYTVVTKEKLQEKLLKEAQKRGANAILITASQVMPVSEQTTRPKFETEYDYDTQSGSWKELTKDFDINYGNARKSKPQQITRIAYRRILKADFLKYTNAAPAKAETPAKAAK